jgi:hypothetical protein
MRLEITQPCKKRARGVTHFDKINRAISNPGVKRLGGVSDCRGRYVFVSPNTVTQVVGQASHGRPPFIMLDSFLGLKPHEMPGSRSMVVFADEASLIPLTAEARRERITGIKR